MTSKLHFDPAAHLLTGPTGSLPVASADLLAQRFLMLLEGQCLEQNVVAVAEKYGYCRQRYYQLLHDFKAGGLTALHPKKTGPKSNYRRTDAAVRQVLRYLFLDPDASPAVIAQKLRQTGFPISLRSVNRIIADYGLQKKTLSPQSTAQSPSPAGGGAKHPSVPAAAARRPPKPRARRAPGAG